MIKLVGVEKTLGKQPVLRGVDLTIPTGKLTTIIGRSCKGDEAGRRYGRSQEEEADGFALKLSQT
jgi:ABC-type transporter Mla maintaining outer membrane lipid asymmetry ATPase subunit MlaF